METPFARAGMVRTGGNDQHKRRHGRLPAIRPVFTATGREGGRDYFITKTRKFENTKRRSVFVLSFFRVFVIV
jgi:hypothetical protein